MSQPLPHRTARLQRGGLRNREGEQFGGGEESPCAPIARATSVRTSRAPQWRKASLCLLLFAAAGTIACAARAGAQRTSDTSFISRAREQATRSICASLAGVAGTVCISSLTYGMRAENECKARAVCGSEATRVHAAREGLASLSAGAARRTSHTSVAQCTTRSPEPVGSVRSHSSGVAVADPDCATKTT